MDAHACSGFGFLSYLVHKVTLSCSMKSSCSSGSEKTLPRGLGSTTAAPKDARVGAELNPTAQPPVYIKCRFTTQQSVNMCKSLLDHLVRAGTRFSQTFLIGSWLTLLFIGHGYGKPTVLVKVELLFVTVFWASKNETL